MASPQGEARERRLTVATATAADRARVFRHARLHTWVVRCLKIGLPLATLAVVALYGWTLMGEGAFVARVPNPDQRPELIDPENLTMDNPVYDGFAKDGSHYVLRAKSAATNLKQTGPIRLNVITGDIQQPTGVVTRLSASWGLFDRTKSVLDLFERIDVDASNGMKARLTQATVYPKDSRIVSSERAHVEMATGTVRGNTLDMNSKTRTATFVGAVEVKLKVSPKVAVADKGADKGTDKGREARAGTPDKAINPLTMRADEPTDVWSDRLDVDDTTKVAFFKGNVRAKQGEATMTAPELEVRYVGKPVAGGPDGSVVLPGGGVRTEKPKSVEGDTARLSLLKARGGVVLSKTGHRATAAEATFDAAADTALMTGSVVITAPGDRKVTGDRVELDQKKDTAVFTGNVVMTALPDRKLTGDRADVDQRKDTALVTGKEVVLVQGANVLRGRRLYVDRKSGAMRLDSPVGDGVAAGRIAAHLVAKDDPAKSGTRKAATKAPSPAAAAASPFGMTSAFKADPSAPTDVDADTLDVDDKLKTATFRGNVIARQGTFEIRSAELIATYSGDGGLGAEQTPAKTESGPKEATKLTKMETRKKVAIKGADGQEASGDWMTFDAVANTVVLGGDVWVSQPVAPGKANIVRGPLLRIDLNTGLYNIDGGTGPAPMTGWSPQRDGKGATSAFVSTGPPTPAVEAPKSRPTLLLFPKEQQDAQKKKKADDAAAGGDAATPVKRPRVREGGAMPERAPGDGPAAPGATHPAAAPPRPARPAEFPSGGN